MIDEKKNLVEHQGSTGGINIIKKTITLETIETGMSTNVTLDPYTYLTDKFLFGTLSNNSGNFPIVTFKGDSSSITVIVQMTGYKSHFEDEDLIHIITMGIQDGLMLASITDSNNNPATISDVGLNNFTLELYFEE